MRIACLYDIHGNLPALEAVLAEVRREGVDRVLVGGDVIPGPMPREALAYLAALDLPVDYISGNGEREVLAARAGVETGTVPEKFRPVMQWVGDQLEPAQVQALDAWPATRRLTVPPLGDVLFCHATPQNDMDIFTRLTPAEALAPIFEAAGTPVVVCGHTHMPFDRMVGRVRVVNAGSVGMPFGAPGAYWLLLGPDVHLRRTDYDLEQAARRIRTCGYPQADEFATGNVLRPPAEADMLAAFARVEIQASSVHGGAS